MFVTPMIASAIPPEYYHRSKRSSFIHTEASARLSTTSTASSDLSSLQRTDSTASARSIPASASAWSLSSDETETEPQTQTRKRFSGGAFPGLRPWQRKKALQSQRKSYETPKRVESLPVTEPKRNSDSSWQCSDLVVRCHDDIYHVDRTIMCYHSTWFTKVCTVVMPLSPKSVIDLSADAPHAVAAMMQYCYQLDYTDRDAKINIVVPENVDLCLHVDVFLLAERYGISGLKQLALQKFEQLATMALVDAGSEEELLKAIRVMYIPGTRAKAKELRQVAIKLCADHVQGFILGTHTTMATIFESMDELPEFRTGLFEEMTGRWK